MGRTCKFCAREAVGLTGDNVSKTCSGCGAELKVSGGVFSAHMKHSNLSERLRSLYQRKKFEEADALLTTVLANASEKKDVEEIQKAAKLFAEYKSKQK